MLVVCGFILGQLKFEKVVTVKKTRIYKTRSTTLARQRPDIPDIATSKAMTL